MGMRLSCAMVTLGVLAATPLGAALADGPAKPNVSVLVSASGFRNTTGQAIVALYASKDTWLKIDKAYRVTRLPITGGTLQATFADVAPGVYAVSVIHDENSNGKLDMHWFPIPGPDEGAGVSNDAQATVGPPSYGDARLSVGEKGGFVPLKIRY